MELLKLSHPNHLNQAYVLIQIAVQSYPLVIKFFRSFHKVFHLIRIRLDIDLKILKLFHMKERKMIMSTGMMTKTSIEKLKKNIGIKLSIKWVKRQRLSMLLICLLPNLEVDLEDMISLI